uniref:Uncharacterized protein n=1 Tax=Arundo donax TaxID=35708 RepID=A0A0A9BQG9_ARUDO
MTSSSSVGWNRNPGGSCSAPPQSIPISSRIGDSRNGRSGAEC